MEVGKYSRSLSSDILNAVLDKSTGGNRFGTTIGTRMDPKEWIQSHRDQYGDVVAEGLQPGSCVHLVNQQTGEITHVLGSGGVCASEPKEKVYSVDHCVCLGARVPIKLHKGDEDTELMATVHTGRWPEDETGWLVPAIERIKPIVNPNIPIELWGKETHEGLEEETEEKIASYAQRASEQLGYPVVGKGLPYNQTGAGWFTLGFEGDKNGVVIKNQGTGRNSRYEIVEQEQT
jgi:hypothetical protein